MPLVECRLSKVVMNENNQRQMILLEEKDGKRSFPIMIGISEVFAIHRFVNKERPPRPYTHELIGDILQALDVSVERVVINSLRDETYYARLMLKRNGTAYDLDSRPSDAIALATLTGAPIFVEEEVIKKASVQFE